MTVTEDRPAPPGPGQGGRQARRRKEDARLITGKTTWTDNMVLPGMLHLAVVRSPVAHAKITNVDLTAAQQAPGVIAVFTGRDFADEQGSIPCAWPVTPDMVNPGHPSVAVEEVNHVGEAVAVIVARSKTAAQDAVELVDVDYDPLPVVLDMEEAVGQDAAPLPRPPGVQRELPLRLRRRRGRHGRRHRRRRSPTPRSSSAGGSSSSG